MSGFESGRSSLKGAESPENTRARAGSDSSLYFRCFKRCGKQVTANCFAPLNGNIQRFKAARFCFLAEVTGLSSDRLRQPDNLRKNCRLSAGNPYAPETHGFASLPRGRFALIVCNRHVKSSAAIKPPRRASATLNIKHSSKPFVNTLYLGRKAPSRGHLESRECLFLQGKNEF